MNLASIVDTSQMKGLSLSRLGKSVTADMLSRRLTQVLDLLEKQLPGLLQGHAAAEAALRALGT